jgi:hypothetical protein
LAEYSSVKCGMARSLQEAHQAAYSEPCDD